MRYRQGLIYALVTNAAAMLAMWAACIVNGRESVPAIAFPAIALLSLATLGVLYLVSPK